ncbi:MAG: InlB B-repeat-containing protein [Clostridia bacterium]|nr:InlB B-repeat-containing protein [Clostridia bacterium]
MKKLPLATSILSVALALLLLVLPLSLTIPSREASDEGIIEESFASDAEIADSPNDLLVFDDLPTHNVELADTPAGALTYEKLAYSTSGYKTYQLSDATLRWTVATQTVNSLKCSSMQGMNVGTTYIYTAKRSAGDEYASIMRTNANTGAQSVMNFYASPTATSTSYCNVLGHANELVVCGVPMDDGTTKQHMFVATAQTGTAIARMKIDGTSLYFTGYFDLKNTSGTSISASAIRHIKSSGGYAYFMIKRGLDFYYCKILLTALGGTASSPTAVTCYKLFTIDTRNAIFAKSNSSYGTLDNMENWTNQGFGYNKTEQVIYVPIWDQYGDQSRNAILTYYIADYVTSSALSATKNFSTVVFPCTLSFCITDTSQALFEIESCNFRTEQGTTGDLKLYFNVNATSGSKEGIYSLSYTTGSATFTPIANDESIVYTVKYNANGGTDSGTGNLKMNATRHVRGIATRLRVNQFTRDGYTFAGWYLTRKSDGKWLYFDTDGTARWYTKGSQPTGSRLALYEDTRKVSSLTTVSGDTVTCYAQWTPNSTGTKTFYIQYDANGGTGTMEDSAIVYGTSTAIRTNTFTREGYVFSGWIAHRRSDNAWVYKSNSELSDKWLAIGEDTTGYFLKAYKNGTKIAKTTSTDCDIVTFYAAWTRIASASVPTTVTVGTDATFGGTVESDAGLYKVTVSIKDASGTTVATKTVNPYATTYNLSGMNSSIDTSSLAAGTYSFVVQAMTLDGSSGTTVTLLNQSFTVQ